MSFSSSEDCLTELDEFVHKSNVSRVAKRVVLELNSCDSGRGQL